MTGIFWIHEDPHQLKGARMPHNWTVDYPELRLGLSQRQDGSMKLLPDGANTQTRQNFFAARGIPAVVSAQVTNGDFVQMVTPNDSGRIIPDTDGLVTAYRDLFLAVTVADCFPVYLFDPAQKVIGLAHAGWRGIASGIISNAVRLMIRDCQCQAQNLLCAVGPGIQQHHFEVRYDAANAFKDYPEYIDRQDKLTINLSGIIVRQLFDLGVPLENIIVSEDCTYCLPEKYFSFRRDKPEIVEAMVAYIGMVDG